MKASELMLGDFLRYKQNYPFTHLQGKIVMVRGLDGRVDVRTIDDGKFHESEHPDWLEPIPLTPEILEKNGFECRGAWCLPGEDMGLRQDGDSWGLLSYYVEYDALAFCHIKYVHELQRALKLCNIDKEIVL